MYFMNPACSNHRRHTHTHTFYGKKVARCHQNWLWNISIYNLTKFFVSASFIGLKNCNAPSRFIRSSIKEKIICCTLTYPSVRVAEQLELPTLDHGVAGSKPAGSEILPEPKLHFIAQGLSCFPSIISK